MVGQSTIVCIPDTSVGALPHACAYIRLLLPLSRPEVLNEFRVNYAHSTTYDRMKPSIIVTQRLAFAADGTLDRLLRHRGEQGARLVYDIDDDLLAIDRDHNEYAHYAAAAPMIKQMIAEADEVWVSTAALLQRVNALGGKGVLLENELDSRLWPAPPVSTVDEPVRVLYMGTTTHQADFESIIVPSVGALVREFSRSQVEFELIGVAKSAPSPWKVRTPPGAVQASYPAFCHWLRNQPSFSIGVAPLSDTAFNRGKSHIKWLEYSAIGAVTVASAIGEYGASITDGVNGVLTDNSVDGFHANLRGLVIDRSRLQALRTRASAEVARRLREMRVARARLARLRDLAA